MQSSRKRIGQRRWFQTTARYRAEQPAKVASELAPHRRIDPKPFKDAACSHWRCATLIRSHLTSRPIEQLS
jgi:hypothetical protein